RGETGDQAGWKRRHVVITSWIAVRVLLIDAPDLFLMGQGQARWVLPMGLACLSAALRPDHDVTMLLPDARAYVGDDPGGGIARAAAAWRPAVTGISAVTATCPAARRLAGLFARELPGVPVVLGGVHVTFCPEDAARLPGVAAVVAGEGEDSFRALL